MENKVIEDRLNEDRLNEDKLNEDQLTADELIEDELSGDKLRENELPEDKNLVMARRVAEKVAAAGGRTFFVGGYVRDLLLHRENKDIDIEVHGILPDTLGEILDSLGKRMEMGASFGVFGLSHYDLDIAMPRKEHAIGKGHKDFAVSVDPFLGTEKAAVRRDFTINALMQDVLTGQVVDHFGGIEDLKAGIIRHINDQTFAEDPLRVLRAAQFAARFEFRIAEDTVKVSSMMDLKPLARERIFGEMEKALLKARKPAIFFQVLRDMDQLGDWFPEVEALIGVEQDAFYHPEGDVWNHTMAVVNAAAQLRDQADQPLCFMLAALCHDFGKVTATKVIDGRIRAFDHENQGVEIARKFLSRITTETKIKKYVSNMVGLHMRPNLMADQKSGAKAFARLFDQALSPEDLLLLAKADRMGQDRDSGYPVTEAFLKEKLQSYKEMMERPFVQGRDLVEAGIAPGPLMGEGLKYAHKLRLSGVAKDDALRQTIAYLRKLQKK